jgi:hypothetical protein
MCGRLNAAPMATHALSQNYSPDSGVRFVTLLFVLATAGNNTVVWLRARWLRARCSGRAGRGKAWAQRARAPQRGCDADGCEPMASCGVATADSEREQVRAVKGYSQLPEASRRRHTDLAL